jgi:hypothetical protein
LTVRGWLFILQRCPLIAVTTSSVFLWKKITYTLIILFKNKKINYVIPFEYKLENNNILYFNIFNNKYYLNFLKL